MKGFLMLPLGTSGYWLAVAIKRHRHLYPLLKHLV
jgi:hypothetical protein